MTEQDITNALLEAIKRAGTQGALSEKVRISQGTISDYLRGRCSIGNMTVSVFLRLFPDMSIDFFGGKSSNKNDLLQAQLLEIFQNLSDKDKLKCIAMVAANFGEKIRKATIK